MKRLSGLILTLSIVFFLTQSLYSAEVPQVQEGAKSVFWGFNGLADLSVDNSVIGGQYNIADRIGIFATLGLGMVSTSIEDEDHMSTSEINFSVGAKLYLFKNDPVSFFVAPLVSIKTSSEEDKLKDEIESHSSFGIGVGFGAEWWFTTNVSLSASTTLGLVSHSKTMEMGSSKSESSSSSFGTMGGHSTHFTLSFYF